MAFINVPAREVCCKIVYCGPGLSGKTTNVERIHARTSAEARGPLLSLKTDTERTLFFDFLPLALGSIAGFKTRLQLYTVPGQIHYGASRRLILRGADGVVFVADSQVARVEANQESLSDIQDCLAEHGLLGDRLSFVVQYNKRDLPGAVPIDELRALLDTASYPGVEAAASSGAGVFETLKVVSKMVLARIRLPHRPSA